MTSLAVPRRRSLAGAVAVALVASLSVATPASASTTATEVVFAADADRDRAYSLDLRDLASGRTRTVLPERPGTTYDEPELSPDGRRIAFSTGSQASAEGIAVVNRDGTGLTRLTEPSATGTVREADLSAAWSPDGTTLLFTRVTTDLTDPAVPRRTSALWTVPASGGPAAAVAGGQNGYTADWHPADPTRIVFALLDPAGAEPDSGPLVTLDLDGGRPTPLGSAVGLMPAWSPDGTTIAYAAITSRDADRVRAHDVTQVATVPAAGGTPRVLPATRPTAARTVAEYPAWLPDGESLVFDLFAHSSTNVVPPGDLWAVDRVGSRSGRLTSTNGDEAQGHVQGPAPRPVDAGRPATYVPVTPRRVLDTVTGLGAPAGKVGPAGTVRLAVRGTRTAQGPVPANASAVVLNLTVAQPTATTWAHVYPSGGSAPPLANVYTRAGEALSNLVTVRIGADGAVTLRNAAGFAHLQADLAGWYAPDTAGLGFAAVAPTRILDTRSGLGAPAAKVGAGRFIDLQVSGRGSVPAGARAVLLSLTGISATATTNVRLYPTPVDGSVPGIVTLNLRPVLPVANLAAVALSTGGKVRLRNASGAVHLAADVIGYYAAGAPGRFVPVTSARVLDTRRGVGTGPVAMAGYARADLAVAQARGVPREATAAVLNLTGIGARAATNARAYATGTAMPTLPSVFVPGGVTRAGLLVARTGSDGRVRVRNHAGETHLVGDLVGYMVG